MERKNYLNLTLKACLLSTLSLTYTIPQVSACAPGLFPTYLNDRLFDSDMELDFTKDLELVIKKLNLIPEDYDRYFYYSSKTTTVEADKQDFFNAINYSFLNYNENTLSKEEKSEKIKVTELHKKFAEQRKNNTIIREEELTKIPVKLQEFFLYANGVAAIKKNPKLKFPKAWGQLLTLKKEYRQYRTAWVYYMLGNLYIKNGKEKLGCKYYKRLRNSYFTDSLGLKYASYRSEAFYCKNIVIKLNALLNWYIHAQKNDNFTDCKTALDEIKYIATIAFNKLNKSQKRETLKNSVARELIILSMSKSLSKFYAYYPENVMSLVPKDCKIISAGRLAWLAFSEGEIEICKNYLQYLDVLSPNRLWLEARILRSEKKYPLAAKKIKLFLKIYQRSRDLKDHFFPKNDIIDDAYGVLGSSLIYRYFDYIDYNENKSLQEVAPEILYAFFKADSWVDVDYVAERLITLADLQAFCDSHAINPKIALHKHIRNTLARRLMRKYKFGTALNYFDSKLKKEAQSYIEMFKKANDKKYSNKERAITLYNMAISIQGLKSNILGTALFPDYSQWHGGTQYLTPHLDCYKPKFYYSTKLNKIPRRYQQHNILAASYLARAANLIDDKNFKAVCLFLAGSFIKVKHPDLADNYFKQLCDLRPHPLAVEANERNWFPTYSREEVIKNFSIDNIIK